MARPRTPEDGFSLVETLVAAALLTTAVVTLAQLSGIAARSNMASRHLTYATVLAAQKLEELRALDIEALSPSPATALDESTPGWMDYVDQAGKTLGDRSRRNSVYVRRWSIQPLAADPGHGWVIQVLVTRPPEEARLVAARTRRAP